MTDQITEPVTQQQETRATIIGLLKNWPVKFRPVIFGLLPYANEI